MSKRAAFDLANKIIQGNNGRPLALSSNLESSEMDDLGYLLLLVGLNKEYPILKDVKKGDELSYLDRKMTMKQLINQCVLSKCPE